MCAYEYVCIWVQWLKNIHTHLHIHVHTHTHLFSPWSVTCVHVLGLIIWHWTAYFCALPWGRWSLLLPAFLSCPYFFVYGWDLAFSWLVIDVEGSAHCGWYCPWVGKTRLYRKVDEQVRGSRPVSSIHLWSGMSSCRQVSAWVPVLCSVELYAK